jgi:hypothetical protein
MSSRMSFLLENGERSTLGGQLVQVIAGRAA